jgi:SAM-dependent methyltransferase
MDADDRCARALSFGSIAEAYDRYRPGPPTEALDWLLAPKADAVVDIGAGTGALTRLLVERVGAVVAIEPDPRMARILASRVPAARVLAARAEELALGDGLFDAVVGSSMWHWVDAPRASAEAARVLRPGGVLGLLWSGPDRSQSWVAEVLGRSSAPSSSPRSGSRGVESPRRHRYEMDLPAHAPFSAPEMHLVAWSLTMTAEDLLGLAFTYSGFAVLPDAERDRRRAELTDVVRHHPAIVDSSAITLPMRCICWRARRLR